MTTIQEAIKNTFLILGILSPSEEETAILFSIFSLLTSRHNLHNFTVNTKISKREKECLHLLANGKSFYEIADEMGIKRTTVATFTKRLKSKLKCDTLAQCVHVGIQRKYIA